MNTGNLEIDRYERNALRAACDAARDAMAVLPDPEEYAYRLPLEVVEALERCWRVPGDWRCRVEDRALLSSYGLADAQEPFPCPSHRTMAEVMREERRDEIARIADRINGGTRG